MKTVEPIWIKYCSLKTELRTKEQGFGNVAIRMTKSNMKSKRSLSAVSSTENGWGSLPATHLKGKDGIGLENLC